MSDAGEIVNNLGVVINLADGDIVTDAIVLAKVVEADGTVRLSMNFSDGMSWIERLGMLTASMQSDSLMPAMASDDDD